MRSSETNSYNTTSSLQCQSYKAGHQVHWLQAKVKRETPRFDVRVEVLDPQRVQISWQGSTKVFWHHLSERIQDALEACVFDYVKFSPESSLLYVQTEEPSELHNGAFSLFYLSSDPLTSCVIRTDAVDISTLELESEDE